MFFAEPENWGLIYAIRTGSADITGKLCVIGSKLDEAGVAALFGV